MNTTRDKIPVNLTLTFDLKSYFHIFLKFVSIHTVIHHHYSMLF